MKLIDMVNYLFSKNAGPFLITFDINLKSPQCYKRAVQSGVFNRETLARTFNIPPERIMSIYEYEPALVLKFTIVRDISSGTFGDRSVFGSQQWAPLMDLEIPDLSPAEAVTV